MHISKVIALTSILTATQIAHAAATDHASRPCNSTAFPLPCYVEKLNRTPLQYSLEKTEKLDTVEHRRYRMVSQEWSPKGLVAPKQWVHDVNIAIPEKPRTERALLFISGGSNNTETGEPVISDDLPPASLAEIARNTNTIAVSVNFIPNQALEFEPDKIPAVEDHAIARSWNLFLNNPQEMQLMPLQFPMAAAASRAISLSEQELAHWNIHKFVVSGMSKRGWTTWLTALVDKRVEAIAPFVIDVPNLIQGLKHIYRSYGDNWPIALGPYLEQNIDNRITSPNFRKLAKLIDPFEYLDTQYRSRLTIPKYVVNASGDDFFVPDGTHNYFDAMPGEKSLRIAPNSSHEGIKGFAVQTLTPFLNRLQANKPLPKIEATPHEQALHISFSEKPEKVRRWTAVNPDSRDFRYACGIRYEEAPLDAAMSTSVKLHTPEKGWEATYVEATFADGFVASTQVYITPTGYPSVAPPVHEEACTTLPGRGLGE
ncbi:PhoPQ-regulated protein [Ochrobactrum sp. CM-21-5]|nr:PhoPQ-activated protein PqaA family protein [Ochrobactrum sp. CM-21-5]MBC2884473.1 PhoPQ-regulated protein [Ochrobactrum sp. CM-21-5]